MSTVFEGSVHNPSDERRVLAEFEANGEKSCHKNSDTSEEGQYDNGHKSVGVYLFLSGLRNQINSLGWRRVMRMVQFVSIPDNVEELCEDRFSECRNFSRATFGECSSLK